MNEQSIPSSGAGRFGRSAQAQAAQSQKLSAPPAERSAVIVVTSPVAGTNKVFSSLEDETVGEFDVNQKAVERLTDLLTSPNQLPLPSAHSILSSEGTQIAIDERFTQHGSTAVVLHYTTAFSASQMYGLISQALFDRMQEQTNLTDIAARYGIHAICVVPEADLHKAVNAISEQLASIETAGRIVPFTEIDDTALLQPVIDWSVVPGQHHVALEGEVRNMLFTNANSELFGIRSEGDQQVSMSNKEIIEAATIGDEEFDDNDELEIEDEDGEMPTGNALFGYDNEGLSHEQRVEALQSIGYDCTDFDEESVTESFLLEQKKWLATLTDEDEDEDDVDADGEESDSEEQDDESESDEDEDEDEQDEDEESDDEEEASLGEQLANVLLDAELDRDQLKKLVFMLELKVLRSDTEESLTAKILEEAESWTEYDNLFQFFINANTKLGGVEAFADWLHANSDEVEDDAEDEDSEEESDAIAIALFDRNAGELNHDERSAALAAIGIEPPVSMVRCMKLFKQTQLERGVQIEDAVLEPVESDAALLADEEENEADFLARVASTEPADVAADEKVEAIRLIDGTDIDADDDELDEMFELVIGQHLLVQSTQPESDVEPAFTLAEDDEQDFEDDEDEDEADDLNYALDNGVNHAAFLTDVEPTDDGELASVAFEQSIVVNFVLTNRNSFDNNNEELVDVEGINYRFPFLPKQEGKGTGAMLLPMANVVELMESLNTTRMLVDTSAFDVHQFADKLQARLNKQLSNGLYEGRIEDGADPEIEGIIVGDFMEDEALDDEEGFFTKEELAGLGDALPIAQLYNGVIGVRPVTIESDSLLINAGVINFMVPGFWSIENDKIENMVNAAINQVRSRIADTTDLKVYVSFTVDSSAIVSDDLVFDAVSVLRSLEGAQVYSKADVALLQENDWLSAASTLDERNLPLTLLNSDVAGHTFALGGDLTVLFACFEEDEEDLDDEEDEGDDE